MIITSFTCNSIVNNTITAVLVSNSVYSNVVIQIAEYGSSGQLTNWTTVSNLTSTNQTISYTLTNPNTTTINVRLKSTSPVCDEGSGSGSGGGGSGSGGGDGSGGGGGDGSGGGGSDGGSGGGSGSGGGGGGSGEGSDESGSLEESGSEESGSGGSETGCDICLSEASWLYICEGSGSEETGGSEGSFSGSGSGSGSPPSPRSAPVPAPPSSPDQHILWPPVRNLGNNNFVLVNTDTSPSWREATNPWRDIYDENLIEDKWTLFYYEITLNETASESGSDSESGSEASGPDRTISAVWVKRKASRLWPGGNVFADYYIYGEPLGLSVKFVGTAQADIGADPTDQSPMYFSGDIYLSEIDKIETVGGYLIEKIKFIADNNYIGDGSTRIMGANVNVLPMGDILSVPATTTTDDLDDITISLLN